MQRTYIDKIILKKTLDTFFKNISFFYLFQDCLKSSSMRKNSLFNKYC